MQLAEETVQGFQDGHQCRNNYVLSLLERTWSWSAFEQSGRLTLVVATLWKARPMRFFLTWSGRFAKMSAATTESLRFSM